MLTAKLLKSCLDSGIIRNEINQLLLIGLLSIYDSQLHLIRLDISDLK